MPVTNVRLCNPCGSSVGIGGDGAVPTNARAAAVNLTVTNTSSAGYATLWPDDQAQPLAADINWMTGQTLADLAGGVRLGVDGWIDTYANAPATLILDLEGYYA